jgi:hypothetical protein
MQDMRAHLEAAQPGGGVRPDRQTRDRYAEARAVRKALSAPRAVGRPRCRHDEAAGHRQLNSRPVRIGLP